jgi:N-methylhydantoinase A
LLPIVRRYLDGLQSALRERGIRAPLLVMRSDGGMAHVGVAGTHPAMLIESGPAGGAIAAAALARSLIGEQHSPLRCAKPSTLNVLSFDMGGTTAKAGTVIDGRVQLATEFEAAGSTHSGRPIKGSGYPVRFPFVDLAEISAGGGTIAWIDDAGGLHVGPLSAGADPGPACYGRADLPTVTDANVVLGRLPQTHLLGGSFPIDAARSQIGRAHV